MQFVQNNQIKDEKETPDINDNLSTGGFIGTIWDYPEDLRENYYIVTGYRVGYSGFLGGIKTLFLWHNETINVWTHFFGKMAVWFTLAWILCTYNKTGVEG